MSDELVRVRDLKKIFSVPAGELHAVDGVDFSIARGSTIGIVGESGCGKSTMGRLLAMLLEATSGEILFDGQNIAKKMSKAEAMAYKKRIQMIFQDPFSSLNPRMTTFETIIEPLNIHRAGTLQEREARVYQLMETVGLSERFVNAYPHELDGGRRQRIGIARALALDPEFVICDEPVSALDVSIQAQILNLLKGELTSPINPKPACRFAPRCPYAKEQCRCSVPEITDLGSGHTIRCFYPQG